MLSSQDLNELKNDLVELESVLGMVNRSNVRMIIADAVSTLRTKIEDVSQSNKEVKEKCPEGEQKPTKQTLYTSKITNYGWDESTKFVKVYITLPNVEKLTQEQISSDFTDKSFKFLANNHNGKNHMLEIPQLANKIVPSSSTCRIKSGNVIVSLKKEKEGTTWGNLTEAEKKQKEKKDSKFDSDKEAADTSDPSAGIMNLMKKMYEDGDDDMKRMIKKTWYESQQKQKTGEMPSL